MGLLGLEAAGGGARAAGWALGCELALLATVDEYPESLAASLVFSLGGYADCLL